jgi:DNA helicase-4
MQKPNSSQLEAIKSESTHVLVLAGAGSGKTKTLLDKINYLIEQRGARPSEILAITFTKNAANEMVDRFIALDDSDGTYYQRISAKNIKTEEKEQLRIEYINKHPWIKNLTIKTFHGFCYQVLRKDGVHEFDNQFKIISSDKKEAEDVSGKYIASESVYDVFHRLLIEKCSDQDYIIKLKRYILDYFVDKIHTFKESPEKLYANGKFYTTLNGLKVRSKSEQFIADWLYKHNIKFEYELKTNPVDFPFRPDFFLPEANLYIEHSTAKGYPTNEKIKQFNKGGIHCERTFEYQANDTALFNHVLDSIVKGHLPGQQYGQTALVYKEEFQSYEANMKKFILQMIRVMDMIKSDAINKLEVAARGAEDPHDRIRIFYELMMPILDDYENYCVKKSYLDFNDLISRTTSLFQNQIEIKSKYQKQFKYILVDEFQDVNRLQVELIKYLITENGQLFCVGDDWQSIYGFRGSDVNYILEFDKHFSNAHVITLNTNYRSTQHIVGASNEVIKQNQFRIDKEIFASKFSDNKIEVFAGKDLEANLQFCANKVRDLLDEGISGEDILFLYRRSAMYDPYYNKFKEENLFVQRKTIHGAKGLEAKVVFIIGLTDGSGGFPDVWLEDRVFQAVKKANHDLLLEEERRLFYVALTRAKDQLFLITDKGNESRFLQEIPTEYLKRNTNEQIFESSLESLCPSCQDPINNPNWLFCPKCGANLKVS